MAESYSFKVSEDDITCPVCFEIYDHPIVWQCGHNTCLKCAEKLQTYQEMQKKPKSQIVCSVCRNVTTLPHDQAQSLPRNIDLINLIQKIQHNQDNCLKCKICPNLPAQNAAYLCLNCDINICELCKEKHQSSENTGHHIVRPIEGETKQKIKLCLLHHKALSLYCKEDKAQICETCASYSKEHKGHDIIDIYSLRDELVPQLNLQFQLLQQKIEQIQKLISQQDPQNLENLKAQKKQEIETIYEKMIQAVIKNKNKNLEILEQMLQNSVKTFDKDLYLNLVKEMQKVSIQTDDYNRLKIIEQNIKRFLSIPLPEVQGFEIDIITNQFNFKQLVELNMRKITLNQQTLEINKIEEAWSQLSLTTIQGNFYPVNKQILLFISPQTQELIWFYPREERFVVSKPPQSIILHPNPSIATIKTGQLILTGGHLKSYEGQNSVYLIEPQPQNCKPTALKFMNKPRHLHSINVINSENQESEVEFKIIVSGGLDDKHQKLAHCEVYNSRQNYWTNIAPMPEPKYCHACLQKGDCLISFGGRNMKDIKIDLIHCYDLINDRWTIVNETLPVVATFLGTCAITETRALIFGYYLEATYEWVSGKYINPIADLVQEGSTFNTYESCVCKQKDGKLYVYAQAYTGNIFRFDVEKKIWDSFKRPGSEY